MMYRVIVERKAVKEIEALADPILSRVMVEVEALASLPRPRGAKKLIGGAGWRVRVGDHRILYTIDDKSRLVTVYRVKHRREVYK
jgi:mRNA interferase RelE/StbE